MNMMLTSQEKVNLLRNLNRYQARYSDENLSKYNRWNAMSSVMMCIDEMKKAHLKFGIGSDGMYHYIKED